MNHVLQAAADNPTAAATAVLLFTLGIGIGYWGVTNQPSPDYDQVVYPNNTTTGDIQNRTRLDADPSARNSSSCHDNRFNVSWKPSNQSHICTVNGSG